MKAIIFANGEFCDPDPPLGLQPGDLVIAADGGSRHCQALDLVPDLLIGDLDSSDPDLIEIWRKAGVKILKFPQDKDQTDLELALLKAQDLGADRILVYGAVGGRLDMTLGNMILLAHPEIKIPVTLICDLEEVHLARAGTPLKITGGAGDTISLIPLGPDPAVVKTRGLQYPLDEDDLHFGYTRGISNSLLGKQAQIDLQSGTLVLIHSRLGSKEVGK